MSGTLYLCATPIGNLEDISIRTVNTLKEVDLIAAEDTRHTLKLINHFQIDTPLTSYHEHNKYSKGMQLIEKLLNGTNIALVTDAGTPGISDPGEDLVKLALENNIKVTTTPGAVAFITALIISGMSTRRFVFEGFLPSDKKERKKIIEKLDKETRTIILYEAPHKLKNTLEELFSNLGNRNIAITRELTKKYEEVKKGLLNELIEYYKVNEPKGEFVIIIEGVSEDIIKEEIIKTWESISIDEHMDLYLDKGMNNKEAMKQVAKDRGVSKRDIYSYITKINKDR